MTRFVLLAAGLAWNPSALLGSALPAAVHFAPGGVNAVRLGGVAVYADHPNPRGKPPRYVLFTHARREIVSSGEYALRLGAAAIVPAAEREMFDNPAAFWETFETARFHDYAQRSTKAPWRRVPVARAVRGNDVLELDGKRFEVIDTPGYSPGAVSYLCEVDGRRIAFTGDLILADGRILDLYSLQDAIPEAKARGYHGYAARAATLIASLRRVAASKPDVLVPSRGPLIANPEAAIAALIRRLQALMASHFSTDALLWYWGPENLRIRSSGALEGKAVDSMPMAEQLALPPWILGIHNSRLIVSESGAAFLVDAGHRQIEPSLDKLHGEGKFRSLEGIWITHYHDDHTDRVPAVSERFQAPVYFTDAMLDILRSPSHYRMPCLTQSPIRGSAQGDGSKLRWREFELTFYRFPGQTLYHGGLHVRRNTGEEVFFVGDSFTPSGLDDYCLHNRNILRDGEGYLYCLDLLRRFPNASLINQHVLPMFRFREAQYGRMAAALRERMRILDELSPWPDRNFLLDESWARLYPYGQEIDKGEFEVQLRIMNHAPTAQTFDVRWNAPAGMRAVAMENRVRVNARTEGRATARFLAPRSGLYVVTVDVRFGSHSLPEWTEAMVRVR